MKKYLLSFILSVAAVVSAKADGYTGVLVDDGTQKTYYLFEEQPTVKYQQVEGVMNACLFTEGGETPVVSVQLQDDATLTVKFETFVRVNLNSAGYATFSAKDISRIATEGVTAYKASVEGETITLTELTTGNIPAGKGVILYGEGKAGAKVDLPVATSGDAADVTDNVLKATTLADGSLATKAENSWALGTSNQFLKYEGAAYIHNRAYLVHEQTAGARSMQILFDGNGTTAIDNIVNEAMASEGKILEGGKIVIIKDGKRYNVVGQLIK